MGFSLRCVITPVADADEAARVLATLTEALPHTRGRVFEAPFLGVLVGADPGDVCEAYDRDPAAFADALARIHAVEDCFDPDDEDERAAAVGWLMPTLLPAASAAVPDRTLAYVDVDCFGGVCMYSGELVRAGQTLLRLPDLGPDHHQRLLAGLFAEPRELDWYFPPFERGFLDGAEVGAGAADPGTRRRPIRAVVEGWVAGLPISRLAPMLFVGLAPDWAVQPMGPNTILLTAGGEDVAMSINADPKADPGERIPLGGRCHVTPAEAEPPLAQLAELLGDLGADYELILASYPDRAPLRRWAP